MDPALQEFILTEPQEAEIEAIVKLVRPGVTPSGLRIVSRFGDVATCRLKVGNIRECWSDEAVVSLKAPRYVSGEPVDESLQSDESSKVLTRQRQTSFSGEGVSVGVIDWGFDFTHPNFLDPNTGESRFEAIWDQSAPFHPSAQKFGYGKIYFKDEINRALQSDRPFDTLGYQPYLSDPDGNGSHGTHTTDIAAGNGTVGEPGMAPKARLIGVHLSAGNIEGLANLGDSVRILEAIDFIESVAKEHPFVINMSVGKHGGSHQGNSLVEQGMDNFLREKPGRVIVNSAGNYYSANIHASGQVLPGKKNHLVWKVDENDRTPNELEIWYPGKDTFRVILTPPNNEGEAISVNLGDRKDIVLNGRTAGRIYHRSKEPNTGNHHIDIFLYRAAPTGEWEVELEGEDVVDGRYHAWIERDGGCRKCQSRFLPDQADPTHTTGSICNGFYTIAVGAYDQNDPYYTPAPFSSAGPTVDGRQKPNLLAPGMKVLAAKSTPADSPRSQGDLTPKSGTSMAAPHVTGTIALLFEAAGKPLPIEMTRKLLLANLQANHQSENVDQWQQGIGILDADALLGTFETDEKNDQSTDSSSQNFNENMNPAIIPSEQTVPATTRDLRLVLDRNAIIRTDPPALASTGRQIPRYELVEVTQTFIQNGREYVFVVRPNLPGNYGPPQTWGWTLASNLEANDTGTINWSTVRSEVVRIANEQYDFWNVPTLRYETNSFVFNQLRTYWNAVGVNPTNAQMGSSTWQQGHPWSAAFICYVLRGAGAGSHFCYNGFHSCYVVCARENRRYANGSNPFWAYDLTTPEAARPEPGDIICKNRSGGTYTLNSINCGNTSHCDIIVSVDRNTRRMVTVGGNVGNKVSRRIVTLDANGFVDQMARWTIEGRTASGPQTEYFALIKFRAADMVTPGVNGVMVKEHFTDFEDYPEEINFLPDEPYQLEIDAEEAVSEGCQECRKKAEHVENQLAEQLSFLAQKATESLFSSREGARFFDAIAFGKNGSDQLAMEKLVSVKFRPREVVTESLEAGDIVLARSFGDGKTHLGYLSDGRLMPRSEVFSKDSRCEGFYARLLPGQADSNHTPVAQRIADSSGRLLPNIMVLRPGNGIYFSGQMPLRENLMEARPPAGSKSNNAEMTWHRKIASGDNPNQRTYYVTSGALGKGGDAVLRLKVRNRNDHKNFIDIFFMVKLRIQLNDAPREMIIWLDGQDDKSNFKRVTFSGKKEIVDESSKSFDFRINRETLLKAYHGADQNELTWFDAEMYWKELGLFKDSLYWNKKSFDFYLVKPVEIINMRKNNDESSVNSNPFDNKYETIVWDHTYSGNEGTIRITLKIGKSTAASSTNETGLTFTSSATTGHEQSTTNETKGSMNFGLDSDFIKAGIEYKYSTTEKLSHSQTEQVAKTVRESKTFSKALTEEKILDYEIPPAQVGEELQLIIKPVFDLHTTDIIFYEDIDEFGMAGSRRVVKDIPIWKFSHWRGFISKRQAK